MNLIDDFDKFWRFWSVRFGVLAAACGAGATSYAGAKALDPALVAGIPQWLLTACVTGSMLFSVGSVLARALKQTWPQIPPPTVPPPASHVGDEP